MAQAEDFARTARLLTFAGALPFALGAFALAIGWQTPAVILALKVYAATILSFLGGIRWALALHQTEPASATRDLALSVVPALAGWLAFFAPEPVSFAVLAVMFAAMGAWDSLTGAAAGFPDWFVRLRIQVTVAVTALMLTAFLLVA
ncbi:MAG TPA: DUF3429 domain-containing protein [Rhizobiaceae bacterium]|nr:DUF3429 domain-containing protein [Rhizobiaceae bacterium]